MSGRNVIQTAFDEFGKTAGFTKKAGSWYRGSDETIAVLNLQKSNYGTSYYVNVAVWLLGLGEVDAPKENKCHIRTRLDDLVPPGGEGRLTELLDLERPMDEVTRREELLGLLREHLLPLVVVSASLKGLRSGEGERLIQRSLVTGPAQRLLQSQPV